MLVERGIQVMNFEVVGDAYAIASNYLRKSGAIADTIATDERLARNHREDVPARRIQQIRLANKAIAEFEARISA